MKQSKNWSSAVNRAAIVLREAIINGENGAFLGSEEQLIERLGVSRPTFRQVARLLEHEQLLVIKRGPGGGFYARWPSIDAVAHVASIYLRIEHATIEDGSNTSAQLSQEAARLATLCKDESIRSRFQAFLDKDKAKQNLPESTADFGASEIEFIDLLGIMCGNPVIRLFLLTLYRFSSSWVGIQLYSAPERIATSRNARIQVAEAILSGDPELATLLWRRRREMQFGWLKDDMGDSGIHRALYSALIDDSRVE